MLLPLITYFFAFEDDEMDDVIVPKSEYTMDEEAEAPEEVDVAVTCWPDCSHDRGRGDLPPGCFVCFPS